MGTDKNRAWRSDSWGGMAIVTVTITIIRIVITIIDPVRVTNFFAFSVKFESSPESADGQKSLVGYEWRRGEWVDEDKEQGEG